MTELDNTVLEAVQDLEQLEDDIPGVGPVEMHRRVMEIRESLAEVLLENEMEEYVNAE